jgi:hypothetical protein
VFDSNVIKLAQPGVFADSLTEVLRSGARALLTQAVEAEVAEFLAEHADLRTVTGHQRVVRHGHLPEREIMTGIGPVAVRQPRVRDREAAEGERIRYSPSTTNPIESTFARSRRRRSERKIGLNRGSFAPLGAPRRGKPVPSYNRTVRAGARDADTRSTSLSRQALTP